MWFRVFSTTRCQPQPATILSHLRGLGITVTGKFCNDEEGWFKADLRRGDQQPGLSLECFLATEEGIRADLQAWAAWLETMENHANHQCLMEHMINTVQVFTLHEADARSNEASTKTVCVELCKFLARETAGVYQVDGEGFFAASGALLLEEP